MGGKCGQSRKGFQSALGHISTIYGDRIATIEVLDTDMMKRDPYRFSPKQLIDWLIEADIHIIVGHLHQGLDHLCWDMEELVKEYERLRGHIGYTGGALDPVFLQDKINYLLSQKEEDYLPTLRIDMPPVSEDGKEILISVADLERIRA